MTKDTRTIAVQKSDIRKRQMELRSTVDPALGDKVAQKLLDLIDWDALDNVNIYRSMPSLHEIPTGKLFETLWDAHPHLRTFTWQKTGQDYQARAVKDGMLGAPAPPGFPLPGHRGQP